MLDRLISLIHEFLDLFKFACIVDAYQQGVILRFGRYHRTIHPGLAWHWPLGIERAITQGVVPSVQEGLQSLYTKDGHAIVVRSIVTWRVSDIRKALLEVLTYDHAVLDATCGVLSKHVSQANWDDLIKPEFAEAMLKDARKRAFRWGIEIMQFQFKDLQKCRSIRLIQEGHDRLG